MVRPCVVREVDDEAAMSPVVPGLLRLASWGLHRFPSNRVLASAAFRLADRVSALQVGHLVTGEPMVLNLGEYIQRHIFMYGTYEEPATQYLQRNSTAGWTFVDVGSCEGYYAVLASALGGKGSHVLAIEPNPVMADQLRSTVRLGEYPIEVLAAGCGATVTTASLTVSDIQGNIGMSSLVETNRGGRTVDIPVEMLDEVCAERGLKPDVVKIDVEGFETQVLQGFARTLEESPPRVVLVELGPRSPSHAAAMKYLSAFGYTAERILDDGTGVAMSSPDELPGVELVAFTFGTYV